MRTPPINRTTTVSATLHALLVAATGSSAFLEEGHVTVHGVEIDAGLGDAGTKLTLRVDYSVDVQVRAIDLGFMSIGMKIKRRCGCAIAMSACWSTSIFQVSIASLSFGEADIGVEDPGGWQVKSPARWPICSMCSAARSGTARSGFTIYRLAHRSRAGARSAARRCAPRSDQVAATITRRFSRAERRWKCLRLFEGRGERRLGKDGLRSRAVGEHHPLNLGGFASLSYGDCDGVNKLVFAIGVDLPGPIPLANSGLGLYGLGGIFGVNAALPSLPPGADPIDFQLTLDPFDTSKYGCAPNSGVLDSAR